MSLERDAENIEPETDKLKDNGLSVVEADAHTIEYQEYLALQRQFTGQRLAKLNVRTLQQPTSKSKLIKQRKIDIHVIPPLIVIYMLTYVDRANVGNAKLFGAQADLHMTGTDWNIGLSLLCRSGPVESVC